MTIDQQGRAHKPAGSPASTGGQFATQTTPAAASSLSPDADRPTAAYRARSAAERSYAARGLAYELRNHRDDLAGIEALEMSVEEISGDWYCNYVREIHADGVERRTPSGNVAAANAISAYLVDLNNGAPGLQSTVLTSRTEADEVVYTVQVGEAAAATLDDFADDEALEAALLARQSVRPGAQGRRAARQLAEIAPDDAAAAIFSVATDEDGEYLAAASWVDADGDPLDVYGTGDDSDVYEIVAENDLRLHREATDCRITPTGMPFEFRIDFRGAAA